MKSDKKLTYGINDPDFKVELRYICRWKCHGTQWSSYGKHAVASSSGQAKSNKIIGHKNVTKKDQLQQKKM